MNVVSATAAATAAAAAAGAMMRCWFAEVAA